MQTHKKDYILFANVIKSIFSIKKLRLSDRNGNFYDIDRISEENTSTPIEFIYNWF